MKDILMEDEIVSIELCEAEETIDITTDGDHLFFANGILTHNSGFDTNDVSMEHISESTGIVHTADFMSALWQQEGDAEASRINMKILKNRFGGLIGKNLEFHINYNTLRITDMQNEIKAEDTSVTKEIMNDLESL